MKEAKPKEEPKEAKEGNKEEEKVTRAGIPKDWICSNIPLMLDIRYCDMKAEMKEYALLITEYIMSQMFRSELKYFKDAAEHIKKGFEQEFQGTWHVVCGINFGSYFGYENHCCILLYRSSIGFLIWKFG